MKMLGLLILGVAYSLKAYILYLDSYWVKLLFPIKYVGNGNLLKTISQLKIFVLACDLLTFYVICVLAG